MNSERISLFSGGGNRNTNSSKALVEFRAGKMSMSGTLVTPDKRKVYVEKEAQIRDNLKEELKSMYLKIAPPIILDQSTTLTDFYETKVQPKTKDEKDPTCAIFSESR